MGEEGFGIDPNVLDQNIMCSQCFERISKNALCQKNHPVSVQSCQVGCDHDRHPPKPLVESTLPARSCAKLHQSIILCLELLLVASPLSMCG